MRVSQGMGLALSLDEMKTIRDHFAGLGRDPTDVELQSLGQAWSEHCCYKSSKVFLREFIFPVQAPYVLDRGDAGVVEFDEDHAYALRIESHNHPSAVEPYGGATTGIGGILRDVLAMGAQPIALCDPLHFGPLDFKFENLPKGVKHPRYLFGGVVAGIRDYGNRVGIPTVNGLIHFDEGYVGNIIVNVACVGFAKKSQIQKNRVAQPGDVFVLCGGRTGRDGIHGVTYASVDLTAEAAEAWSGGAVQIGDAIVKEPLIHACLDAAEHGLLHGMKDLGGGGLSCVVGEMARNGGLGAEVDLERVPLKEEGLAPWEIWVSESQERMMLAVPPEHVDRVLKVCDLYDVLAAPIGRAIPGNVCRVSYRGELVLEVDLDFYTGGPEYCRAYESKVPAVRPPERYPEEPDDYAAVLLRVLASPNVANKELVVRQYDHEVRASTVIKPLHGIVGRSSHGDASVVRPLVDSHRALAIACASTPQFTAIDPFRGGATAVDEACRNLVAVGARPHSLTNCLNFGNPEKPDRLGFFREAVRGIGTTAQALGIPIPSGNVSFYNESALGPAPPTPVVMGVGIVEDFRTCVTSDFKSSGNPIYLVGETHQEMGGSEYFRVVGGSSGVAPNVDVAALKGGMDGVLAAIRAGDIAACHDLSQGGLAVAVAEMCLGGDVGASLDLSSLDPLRLDFLLFSETNARWLLEIHNGHEDAFESNFPAPVARVGTVGGRTFRIRRGRERSEVGVDEMRDAWSSALPRLVVG
ncbi:MAG: phosphoribosylformylglycinamidine synthase subunit PurL [Euryarchaeota archaeon]|nr:phosphoribosylformylglycinamidine synthase subunit PurL [Euryarchaeota archaeon]